MSERRLAWLPYLALAALALIWGVSFLFIKVAIHDMGPTMLVLIRSAAGTVALAVIMRAMGRRLVPPQWRRRLVPYAVVAIVGTLLPWAAIAWGEEHISSGLASILNATTPLWAAVLVYWVIPTERPSPLNYAGVLLGFGGVAVLVWPKLAAAGLTGDALAATAVVLASFCYAVAALYQRVAMRGMDPYEASLGQLALTVVFTIPFAAPALPSIHLAVLSMAAVIALGVAGSAVAYVLYYYILNSLGPVRATGVTLLVPVTAVLWGALLLNEAVTLPIVAGMVVILAGIVLANLRPARRRQPAIEPDSAAA
ncbi:DMT family transporter [bacterium]|nr:MAG: DMT family transporter [bacterium]